MQLICIADITFLGATRDRCTSDCTLTYSSGLILAVCTHPNSSFTDGIQVIVQSANVSEVHKLYVNQSMDLDTSVTIPVERDGEYQVSIFAIREGKGILRSGVGYTQQVIVHTSVIMSTTAGQPNHISTTPGIAINSYTKDVIPLHLLGTLGCEEARVTTIGMMAYYVYKIFEQLIVFATELHERSLCMASVDAWLSAHANLYCMLQTLIVL